MASKYFLKIYQHLPPGKCKLKLFCDSASSQSECLPSRKQMITDAGKKCVGKKPFFAMDGSRHCGNQCAGFSKHYR